MPQLVRVVALLFLVLLNQHYGVGRDTFFAAGKAQFLGSGGLDRDIILVAANDLSHASLHIRNVWIHFGALGTDGGIDVNQLVALCGYQLYGFLQYHLTVHAVGKFGGVRKVVTNVTHVGST